MTQSKYSRAPSAVWLAAIIILILGTLFALMQRSEAQVPPNYYVQSMPVVTAKASSGAASSVRNVNLPKTYAVTASVAAGTGTAAVTMEGSMSASGPWASIGSVTITMTTSAQGTGLASDDRWMFVRPNATTLSGSTPSYSVTAGF